MAAPVFRPICSMLFGRLVHANSCLACIGDLQLHSTCACTCLCQLLLHCCVLQSVSTLCLVLLNTGDEQDNIRLLIPEKRNHKLPESFTTVPAVALKTANVSVPQQSNMSIATEEQLEGAFLVENNWLIHASELLEKGELEKGDTVAWAAFHATK